VPEKQQGYWHLLAKKPEHYKPNTFIGQNVKFIKTK
jgi:hypothetical protein